MTGSRESAGCLVLAVWGLWLLPLPAAGQEGAGFLVAVAAEKGAGEVRIDPDGKGFQPLPPNHLIPPETVLDVPRQVTVTLVDLSTGTEQEIEGPRQQRPAVAGPGGPSWTAELAEVLGDLLFRSGSFTDTGVLRRAAPVREKQCAAQSSLLSEGAGRETVPVRPLASWLAESPKELVWKEWRWEPGQLPSYQISVTDTAGKEVWRRSQATCAALAEDPLPPATCTVAPEGFSPRPGEVYRWQLQVERPSAKPGRPAAPGLAATPESAIGAAEPGAWFGVAPPELLLRREKALAGVAGLGRVLLLASLGFRGEAGTELERLRADPGQKSPCLLLDVEAGLRHLVEGEAAPPGEGSSR